MERGGWVDAKGRKSICILRTEVIWLHHDTLVGEYGEQWKTVELVTRNFWWPGVTREVKKYVEGYNLYQRNKN